MTSTALPIITTRQGVEAELVLVENIYHQVSNQNPHAVHLTQSAKLILLDAHPRTLTGTAESQWSPLFPALDFPISVILLVNNAGENLQYNPTDEEESIINHQVLALTSDPSRSFYWSVPPNNSLRACPSDPRSLQIKSLGRPAPYTLHVFPA